MNPDEIELKTTSRMFTYEKMSRDLDDLNLEEIRQLCKCYMKLYLKQQESILSI
jgi:hypothetical protein